MPASSKILPRRALVVMSVLGAMSAGVLPAARALSPQAPDPVNVSPAARDTEPVVLTGASFPAWSAPAEVTVKAPTPPSTNPSDSLCTGGSNSCSHNRYEDPEVDSSKVVPVHGVDVHALLGYRWDDKRARFEQIPFQVDEFAVRYISNNASTFSVYSWTDQHLTPVFDQERFRWTANAPATAADPNAPCRATAAGGITSTPDNVPGLDNNDEVAFQASDAGPAAPSGEPLPKGIDGSYRVTVTDPLNGRQTYVYVMKAADGPKAPRPRYDATNGYVRYLPDADSDTYLFSQSSYSSYGNAATGPYWDPATNTCVGADGNSALYKRRRPKDTAWIKTPSYEHRYDGRWLMTQEAVAAAPARNRLHEDPSRWTYGPDLVDQWKARAFQQRPGGETPCCGYEEEVNNWGGSSTLMGVRAGPVRVIRATWGSDSATNNVRTETFYRDEVRFDANLRVHVIPPGDGIYAQWDFNAGKVDTYYNPYVPKGVPVDGHNDEVFGNARVHAGSDGVSYQSDDTTGVAPVDQQVNHGIAVGQPGAHCPAATGKACISNDVDVVDPTFSGPTGTLNYEEVTGAHGTFVDRYAIKQVTGGAAYTLVTEPYYRDDSCFDDGTGTDPGPHVNPRALDGSTDANGRPRACWTPADGDPLTLTSKPGVAKDHFYQGDIGTHGVHIELIADSDNAATTEPIDEIDSTMRRVILPGRQPNVGPSYGMGTEKPLVTTSDLESRPS